MTKTIVQGRKFTKETKLRGTQVCRKVLVNQRKTYMYIHINIYDILLMRPHSMDQPKMHTSPHGVQWHGIAA